MKRVVYWLVADALISGALFPARACSLRPFTRFWMLTDQVNGGLKGRGLCLKSNCFLFDDVAVHIQTASFLVQSCGIQLAVFVLQSASHILFHFFDASFPKTFRPNAAAAMQSLISTAHTHLASTSFTTHLPALSLRLRSWSSYPLSLRNCFLALITFCRAFSLDSSAAFACGDCATAAINARAAVCVRSFHYRIPAVFY